MEGSRLPYLGNGEAEKVRRREARGLWLLLVCGKDESRQALERKNRDRKGRDRQGGRGEQGQSQAKGCFYSDLLALSSEAWLPEPLLWFPGPA